MSLDLEKLRALIELLKEKGVYSFSSDEIDLVFEIKKKETLDEKNLEDSLKALKDDTMPTDSELEYYSSPFYKPKTKE